MKAVHAKLTLRIEHFNALVAELQAAMDAADVPFADQNRLLAKLAPMYPDMIPGS